MISQPQVRVALEGIGQHLYGGAVELGRVVETNDLVGRVAANIVRRDGKQPQRANRISGTRQAQGCVDAVATDRVRNLYAFKDEVQLRIEIRLIGLVLLNS